MGICQLNVYHHNHLLCYPDYDLCYNHIICNHLFLNTHI